LVIGGATIVFAELANTHTSDIYDPNTHNFTPSVNMLSSRNSPSATLLQDGHILVTGGLTCCFQLRRASAELLNPSSAVDQPAGNMLEARAAHTATLLQNGHVLIAGGGDAAISAELYVP